MPNRSRCKTPSRPPPFFEIKKKSLPPRNFPENFQSSATRTGARVAADLPGTAPPLERGYKLVKRSGFENSAARVHSSGPRESKAPARPSRKKLSRVYIHKSRAAPYSRKAGGSSFSRPVCKVTWARGSGGNDRDARPGAAVMRRERRESLDTQVAGGRLISSLGL